MQVITEELADSKLVWKSEQGETLTDPIPISTFALAQKGWA